MSVYVSQQNNEHLKKGQENEVTLFKNIGF